MFALPKIAIVGRPNVGKSALFNRIAGRRLSIVDEAAGITRDRLSTRTDLFGRPFELIDTGGIDPTSDAPFNDEIKEQAEIAIEIADGLIFVVDGQVGATDLDLIVAKILRRIKKPLIVAVNKADQVSQEKMIDGFHCLGIKQMIAVSALQDRNIAELIDRVLSPLPETEVPAAETNIKVAIIGRPNVGKSTLVNSLIDEHRCIVSPIAGTTRDSIDIPFSFEGHDYTLIDTAGIRRKKSEKEVVEKFAAIRTERAIERADVCVLVLDVREGLTAYEKRIATIIEEAGKGCVILFNKWDLSAHCRMEHAAKAIHDEVPFLQYCPKVFGSAKTGRNLPQLLEAVERVSKSIDAEIATGPLNRFLKKAMQMVHPPMLQGKRLRVYYMTQTGTRPLRFILFVNYPNLMDPSYQRYLYNQFRDQFACEGAPVVFQLRGKNSGALPRGAIEVLDEQTHDIIDGEEVSGP